LATFKGKGDECAAAADIYQCGKENAPAVTNAIQTQLTSNVPVAGVIIINKLKSFIEFQNYYRDHCPACQPICGIAGHRIFLVWLM